MYARNIQVNISLQAVDLLLSLSITRVNEIEPTDIYEINRASTQDGSSFLESRLSKSDPSNLNTAIIPSTQRILDD